MDICLWDAKTLKPIWHATTDSYDKDRGIDGMKRTAQFIAKALKDRGYVK